jgi:GTPase Era involved in 16S rRNA processing
MNLLTTEEIRKLKMPQVLELMRELEDTYDLEMPLVEFSSEALDEVDAIANMLASLLDQRNWLEDTRYILQHSLL